MAENIYSITLSDGTIIPNLELDGGMFRSRQPVSRETFSGKLGRVVITGAEPEGVEGFVGERRNMELAYFGHVKHGMPGAEAGYYFMLGEIPAAQMERLQDRADIDYVAMMTGVEL